MQPDDIAFRVDDFGDPPKIGNLGDWVILGSAGGKGPGQSGVDVGGSKVDAGAAASRHITFSLGQRPRDAWRIRIPREEGHGVAIDVLALEIGLEHRLVKPDCPIQVVHRDFKARDDVH